MTDIVFEDDYIQIIHDARGGELLLVTYGAVAMRADGRSFFGQNATTKLNISALGIMPKSPHWYPQHSMRRAQAIIHEVARKYSNVVTYGFSMGAYGAVKYARLVGAHTVIAFSPQYTINPLEIEEEKYQQYKQHYVPNLHDRMAIGSGDHAGDVFIFYDRKFGIDKYHVDRIAKAMPLKRVFVDYYRHETVRAFRGSAYIGRLISLCRSGDREAVQRFTTLQRKTDPMRQFGVAMACLEQNRHLRWAMAIYAKAKDDFSPDQRRDCATRMASRAQQPEDLSWATICLEELARQAPADPTIPAAQARLAFRRQDYREAARFFESILSLRPTDSGAWRGLVDSHFNGGDWSAAREAVHRALAAMPDDVALLRRSGEICIKLDDLPAAMDVLEVAMKAGPADVLAHYLRAELHFRMNQPEAGLRLLNYILSVRPDYIQALRLKADVCLRSNLISEALDVIRALMKADPRNVAWCVWMVDVALKTGDALLARAALTQAQACNPDHPQVRDRAQPVARLLAQPPPWHPQPSQYRRATPWREGPGGAPDILLMGDSITDHWLRQGAEAAHAAFGCYSVINAGVSGETVQGLLWRVRSGEFSGLSPRVVALMIGTNNIGKYPWADIAMAILELRRQVQATLPRARILLLGLTPRGACPRMFMRDQVVRINQVLSAAMRSCGADYLDAGDALLEDDGTLSAAMAPDGLHFSALGYARLAPRLAAKLAEMLGDADHDSASAQLATVNE